MTTTLTYRMHEVPEGYLATCEEFDVQALGVSATSALEALRIAAEHRLKAVEAVAPPAKEPSVPQLELIPAPEADDSSRPQGPGDSPAAESLPQKQDVAMGARGRRRT